MKKFLSILVLSIFTLSLCGCGDKITTAKCSSTEDGMEMTFDLSATNDEIDKVKLVMEPDNSMFGVDSLDILEEEQKEQVKANMLTTLGLNSETNEGMTIDIEITDKMVIIIDADLTKADPELLKKVGMDFEGADMSLERAVKDMEADNFTCE